MRFFILALTAILAGVAMLAFLIWNLFWIPAANAQTAQPPATFTYIGTQASASNVPVSFVAWGLLVIVLGLIVLAAVEWFKLLLGGPAEPLNSSPPPWVPSNNIGISVNEGLIKKNGLNGPPTGPRPPAPSALRPNLPDTVSFAGFQAPANDAPGFPDNAWTEPSRTAPNPDTINHISSAGIVASDPSPAQPEPGHHHP